MVNPSPESFQSPWSGGQVRGKATLVICTHRAIDDYALWVNVRVYETSGRVQKGEALAQLQDAFLDLQGTRSLIRLGVSCAALDLPRLHPAPLGAHIVVSPVWRAEVRTR